MDEFAHSNSETAHAGTVGTPMQVPGFSPIRNFFLLFVISINDRSINISTFFDGLFHHHEVLNTQIG